MPMKEKKSMRPRARPKTFDADRPKARPRDIEKSRGEMMAREEIRRRSAVPPTEESITRGLDERGEMMRGYKDGGRVESRKMSDEQKYRPADARGAGPGAKGRAKIRAARDIASKSKGSENEGTIYGLRSEGSRLLGQDYGRKVGDVGEVGYYADGGMVRSSGRAQVSGKGFRGTY